MKCEVCKRECKNIRSLSIHIVKKHKIEIKEYYNKYLRTDISEGICLECKKESKFLGFRGKYQRFCSQKCAQKSQIVRNKTQQTIIDLNIKNSERPKEIIEKRIDTCKDKYGGHCPYSSLIVRKKGQTTSQKNYGKDHPSQTQEFQDRRINTCNNKYGGPSPYCSKEIQEKGKQKCLSKYGVDNYSKTSKFKEFSRIQAIKERDIRYNNGEPLMPNIGPKEREFLNTLQLYTIYNIIRNDHNIAIKIGRFPDGHIPELNLFIQFDERAHFLDKEYKLYKQDDIDCTLQLASMGYIIWRVSEFDWKNNKEKVINDFKLMIQISNKDQSNELNKTKNY